MEWEINLSLHRTAKVCSSTYACNQLNYILPLTSHVLLQSHEWFPTNDSYFCSKWLLKIAWADKAQLHYFKPLTLCEITSKTIIKLQFARKASRVTEQNGINKKSNRQVAKIFRSRKSFDSLNLCLASSWTPSHRISRFSVKKFHDSWIMKIVLWELF